MPQNLSKRKWEQWSFMTVTYNEAEILTKMSIFVRCNILGLFYSSSFYVASNLKANFGLSIYYNQISDDFSR